MVIHIIETERRFTEIIILGQNQAKCLVSNLLPTSMVLFSLNEGPQRQWRISSVGNDAAAFLLDCFPLCLLVFGNRETYDRGDSYLLPAPTLIVTFLFAAGRESRFLSWPHELDFPRHYLRLFLPQNTFQKRWFSGRIMKMIHIYCIVHSARDYESDTARQTGPITLWRFSRRLLSRHRQQPRQR